MYLNENIISEVVMVTVWPSLTDHMIAKHFELVLHCLSTCRITPQILGRKTCFKNKSKQPELWQYPRQQASHQLESQYLNVDLKIQLVRWADKQKSVSIKWRSNKSWFCCAWHGTAYSAISSFHWNLESRCGYIIYNRAYLFSPQTVLFLNKAICCIWTETEQIHWFE